MYYWDKLFNFKAVSPVLNTINTIRMDIRTF